jgi:hypothetical protein
MIRLSPCDLPTSAGEDSTWSNPAKLSGKARELAHRSRRALKAEAGQRDPASRSSRESQPDVSDLLAQLARLQHKIHALGLGGLVPWINVLKRQVENRLNSTEKETAR